MNTKANSTQQENELRGVSAADPHLAELRAIRGLVTILAMQAAVALKDRLKQAEVLGDDGSAGFVSEGLNAAVKLLTKYGVEP